MKRAGELVDAACTVCRAREHVRLFAVSGFDVVSCGRCGHRYISPRPTPEDVAEIYGDTYFENPGFVDGGGEYFGYEDYFGERDNIDRLKKRLLVHSERHIRPGSLLDIGCGPGFLVDLAARRGWDAWGVDVNEQAVRWADEHGIKGVRACAPSDLADIGPFDCITMLDVIEHLDDPRQYVAELAPLVRPGGLLVVVTPNAGAMVPRVLGRHWMEMRRAPEHLHFFSIRTLGELLSQTGFVAFEHHSIGKIASVHNLLAELKFYARRPVGIIDRWVERIGWGDRAIEIDPGAKVCVYARRQGEVVPLDEYHPSAAPLRHISRRAFRALDKNP